MDWISVSAVAILEFGEQYMASNSGSPADNRLRPLIISAGKIWVWASMIKVAEAPFTFDRLIVAG
jgi:hypothetical protein